MPPRTRRQLLRGGLALSGLGLLIGCGLPLRSEQSAPGGTNRHLIGVLGDSPSSRWDAFRAGLRELGWIEGQNLAVEYRWIEGNSERYRALTDELVRSNVELVVAETGAASRGAKLATRTVPISPFWPPAKPSRPGSSTTSRGRAATSPG